MISAEHKGLGETPTRIRPSPRFARGARTCAWAILLIVGFLAADRLAGLGARGFHHDEALHAKMSWQVAQEGASAHKYDPVYHGPFLYHTLALFFRVFGDGDATARLPFALAGIALVLTMLVWRRWLGWGGAAVLMAFLALSPVLAFYSRFARNDVHMALLLVGEITAGMWYLRTGRKGWLTALAACLVLTHCVKENSYIHHAILGAWLAAWFALRCARSPRSTLRRVLVGRMPLTRLLVLWALASTAVFLYAAVDSRIGADEDLIEGLRRLSGKLVAIEYQADAEPLKRGFLTAEGRGELRRVWLAVSLGTGVLVMALLETAGFRVRRPRARPAALFVFFLGVAGFYGVAAGAVATLDSALRAAPEGERLWAYGREWGGRALVLLLATALALPGEWLGRKGDRRRRAWTATLGELALLVWHIFLIVYVYILFFSSLGANPQGPSDGLYEYVAYWFRQQTGEYRIWGAWWYYLPRLALYEAPALALIIVLGAWWIFMGRRSKEKNRSGVFRPIPPWLIGLTAWLTLATIAAYSLLNEKVPWLLTYPALAVNLLAGLLLAHWLATRGRLGPGLAGLLVPLVLFQLYQHGQAVFVRSDEASELINHTTSSPEYIARMRDLQSHAEARETLGLPPLRIAVQGIGAWPAAWYLRGMDAAWGVVDSARDVQIMDDTPANWRTFREVANGLWELERVPLRGWWIWHGDTGGLPGGNSLLANLRAFASNAPNDQSSLFPSRARPAPWIYETGFARQIGAYVFGRNAWLPITSEHLAFARRRNAGDKRRTGGRMVRFTAPEMVIGEGLLSAPRGLAAMPDGGVAVADSAHGRIVLFDSQGAFKGQLGAGILTTALTGPAGLVWRTTPTSETLVVADTWAHSLRLFTAKGGLLLSRAAARDANGRVGLYGPRGLALDGEGRILATDTGNHVVRVFDSELRPLATWGAPGKGPGQFREPVGIVVGRGGWVYVADAGNGRVQRLTHEGAHDRSYSWTQVGDPPDLDVVGLEPHLAALDDGRIVVSLSLLGELRVLEPESGAWSVWSVGRPALLEPVGLAADGRGGLWVADRALNRVARIRLEE